MNKERQNEPLFLCIRQITSLGEVKAAPFPSSLLSHWPSLPQFCLGQFPLLLSALLRSEREEDGRTRTAPAPGATF